jgi:hypothetical protein
MPIRVYVAPNFLLTCLGNFVSVGSTATPMTSSILYMAFTTRAPFSHLITAKSPISFKRTHKKKVCFPSEQCAVENVWVTRPEPRVCACRDNESGMDNGSLARNTSKNSPVIRVVAGSCSRNVSLSPLTAKRACISKIRQKAFYPSIDDFQDSTVV